MNISRVTPFILAPLVMVLLSLPQGALAATSTATVSELTAQVKLLQAKLMLLQATKGMGVTITPIVRKASFDQKYYTSRASHPIITGTANVESVYVIFKNADGIGFVGTTVPVVKGRWSHEPIIALTPGYYTIELSGGEKALTRNLHVLGK